jgi:hypothetical protein
MPNKLWEDELQLARRTFLWFFPIRMANKQLSPEGTIRLLFASASIGRVFDDLVDGGGGLTN